jgi:hypothetical protein
VGLIFGKRSVKRELWESSGAGLLHHMHKETGTCGGLRRDMFNRAGAGLLLIRAELGD